MKVPYISKILVTCLLLAGPSVSMAAWNINFQPGNTVLADDIQQLHLIVMFVCVVIFVDDLGSMMNLGSEASDIASHT